MRRAQGFTLVDLLLAAAIVALLALISVPPLLRAAGRSRLRLAAADLDGALHQARMLAVRHSAHVGVKFFEGADGRYRFAIYRDADGDGVLTEDIDSGTDPQMMPTRELAHLGEGVGFGFPPGRAPRDPGDRRRRLDRLEDPIRFNRSSIASFGPVGESTPGTLYLTDGVRFLAAVRVLGRTGRTHVLMYDPQTETWQ